PVNDIVALDPTLFVGTDVGVFFSTDGGVTWLSAGTELPNVPVTDLEYRVASNALYAATFGRGIYALQLLPVPTPTPTPTGTPGSPTPTPTSTVSPTSTPTSTPSA